MKNIFSKNAQNPHEHCICARGGALRALKFRRKNLKFFALKNSSFTLAELLIAMTIIGILAAIIIPSLLDNLDEKKYAAQRKALVNRITQSISLMPSLNGYGIGPTDEDTINNAAMSFLTNGLSKVYEIKNICSNTELKKCDFPDKLHTSFDEQVITTPKTLNDLNSKYVTLNNYHTANLVLNLNAAVFETNNGESILTFYNPNCTYDNSQIYTGRIQDFFLSTVCANFVYDLNGRKAPNTIGKDMGFITVFKPWDSEVAAPLYVAPVGFGYLNNGSIYTIEQANAACRRYADKQSRVANIADVESTWVNAQLIGNRDYLPSSSGTIIDDEIWGMESSWGYVTKVKYSESLSTKKTFSCIKRIERK